jgi:transposase
VGGDRRLHFSGKLGIKTIARRLGLARNTVRAAVRSERPPAYQRHRRGSAVDAVEDEIRQLLRDTPTMPASVIAERIGWERGMTVLRERVAELRPACRLPDPCQRTEYRPGDYAQYDLWFPDVDIPVADDEVGRFPVFVGVSCHSQFLAARMIRTRQAHDVLGGHVHCLGRFGATPRTGVYD